LEKKLIVWTLYSIALENFALALIPLYFTVIKVIHGSVDISLLLTVFLWIILLLIGLFFLERSRKTFKNDKDKEEAKKEQ
jgi:hypothetical protein